MPCFGIRLRITDDCQKLEQLTKLKPIILYITRLLRVQVLLNLSLVCSDYQYRVGRLYNGEDGVRYRSWGSRTRRH